VKYKWCAYGVGVEKRLGKIVSYSKKTVEIRYTQGQYYPPELWDNKPVYVLCFEEIGEAIKECLKHSRIPKERFLEYMSRDFDEARRYIKDHVLRGEGNQSPKQGTRKYNYDEERPPIDSED